MTTLPSPPLLHRKTSHQIRLKNRWKLLFLAFIAGGIYEVIDNVLGLRQFNFESSAPTFFKLTKEVAILWLLFGLVQRNGLPHFNAFNFTIIFMVIFCVLSVFTNPPSTFYAQAGFIYYLVSLGMLLTTYYLLTALAIRQRRFRPIFCPSCYRNHPFDPGTRDHPSTCISLQ